MAVGGGGKPGDVQERKAKLEDLRRACSPDAPSPWPGRPRACLAARPGSCARATRSKRLETFVETIKEEHAKKGLTMLSEAIAASRRGQAGGGAGGSGAAGSAGGGAGAGAAGRRGSDDADGAPPAHRRRLR